jgi:hypothetical protein
LLFNFKALDSPKQAVKRLVHVSLLRISSAVLIVSSWAKLGAELGLAHRSLPGENRSHSPELRVQYQDLVREIANRLDHINDDLSLVSIQRHRNFSTASPVDRGPRQDN